MPLPHAIDRPISGLPAALRLAWFARGDYGYGIIADPSQDGYIGIWVVYGGRVAQAYRSGDAPERGVRELLRDGYRPADAPRLLSPYDPLGCANLGGIVTNAIAHPERNEFILKLPADEPLPEIDTPTRAAPLADAPRNPEGLIALMSAGTWSSGPEITADDWRRVVEGVIAAAREVDHAEIAERPLADLLMENDQANAINGIYHAAIVECLAQRGIARLERTEPSEEPRGEPGAKRQSGGLPDLQFFGYPLEIKTASGRTISTNRSYSRDVDHSSERLLVATNFYRAPTPEGTRLRPWLIRAGFVGPADYEAMAETGKGQLIPLKKESYKKLSTLWHAPLEELPAVLVKGVGPLTHRILGRPNTVAELRAAIDADPSGKYLKIARFISIEQIAEQATTNWPDPSVSTPQVRKRAKAA